MTVTLVAHFEWVEEAGRATWWADSPDVAGFYAAAPSFGELQRDAQEALLWALQEEGHAEDADIEWTTETDVPVWAATHVAFHPEGLGDVHTFGAVGPRSHQTAVLHFRRLVARIGPETERNFSLNV